MEINKEALEYHKKGRPGKIEVIATKDCSTAKALSLAYSPGVASPCMEIARNPEEVFTYTSKGNLVAVISNGTAVLGLGDIGPLASKPVMEGKGVLFKKFADIDVFDIEVNARTVDEFVETIARLEPTFGGINLEDIKAPECFEIEKALQERMNIPVFHDDQHGTAIVSGAALLNAVELQGKKLSEIKLVINGAGASAQACAHLFISLGVQRENLIMCDSQGTIYKGRTQGMNSYKEQFAVTTSARNLAEAMQGADVFVGLSVAGAVTPEMVRSMAERPIVFAMANPEPEILPSEAMQIRQDLIMATGRSDFPNQVNNVLGFPFIFRGALDVRARKINEEMKLAAVHAIAKLAREDVPESVSASYSNEQFRFGPQYIIPKPFDPRVLLWVAPAVAKAAMDSGVARVEIKDFDAYRNQLETQHGPAKEFVRNAINRVQVEQAAGQKARIVFADATSDRVLKAVQEILDENIAEPILVGYPDLVREKIRELELDRLDKVQILHPSQSPRFHDYVENFYEARKRKGVTWHEAARLMSDPNYYAAMMVKMGDADAVINGATQTYKDAVKPILKSIGPSKTGVIAGMTILLVDNRVLFFTDTTVNVNPSAEQLAEISLLAADVCQYFELKPRIAMLSYSSFSGLGENPKKMKKAAALVKEKQPELEVDGELQADIATNPDLMQSIFPFSDIKKAANILVFPNLDAGNIAYKLLQSLGKATVIGPFLLGVRKPAHVLQRTCKVEEIVHTAALTALQVHTLRKQKQQRAEAHV